MKVLSLRLRGKMAHFRRYYSNSSALTYSVPPRTTIAGILAGLLGYERDSYYELFDLEQCRIALANAAPIKKIVQKMNLLMIKSFNDVNGSQENHSQCATELVIPQNIRTGMLDYRIWIHHRDPEVMEQLISIISPSSPVYFSRGISLALGTAWNAGWMEFGGIFEGVASQESRILPIDSIVPARMVTEINVPDNKEAIYRLVKEDLPLEFDRDRRLTKRGKGSMIINLLEHPIHTRVKEVVKLEDNSHIVWMQ
ncbi:CRISPR-associated protein Cas5 [Paenibacillus thiaminolyticus]|uniref:CRISPR-associated protein Cas5 n=1 Tax=Paenibacillus thiaminolyticus TaxID=49283 RepID=UPI001162BD86|nr:CRISPR-associated protein Cas5 [Paenibacillus thiaminolyticus]